MIINKLKIGLITAAISMFAIPVASASSLPHLKAPTLNKIAMILDIRVNVLKSELRQGNSVMEIAEDHNATKSEIKQVKKVLRIARHAPAPVVKKVVKTVVVKKVVVKRPVKRVVVVKKVTVVKTVVVKKVVKPAVRRPGPLNKIADVIDISVPTLKRELKEGRTVLQVAKEFNATKAELRQLKIIKKHRNR